MSTKMEEAAAKKQSGYNCAQAVACTFCEQAGVDETQMKHLTQAFGAGFGTMEGTCGALSGAAVVLGLVNGDDRQKTARDIRVLMGKFKERNGSVTCKELKGVGTGVVLRPCIDCVRDAVEFLEEALNEQPSKSEE